MACKLGDSVTIGDIVVSRGLGTNGHPALRSGGPLHTDIECLHAVWTWANNYWEARLYNPWREYPETLVFISRNVWVREQTVPQPVKDKLTAALVAAKIKGI